MGSCMDRAEVRLRLLEAVIPTASKVGLTNSQELVQIASTMEEYVMEAEPEGRETLSLNKGKGHRNGKSRPK